MTSWREAACQKAQNELDGLLDPALGFAQQQLDKYREFYPYAVVVDADGQQRMVAADTGTERPPSADLITLLVTALAEQRDELRATALVADVHLAELKSDAIRVSLEHSEGVALSVLLPCRPRRFGRGIDYGDMRAGGATPFIWPAASSRRD